MNAWIVYEPEGAARNSGYIDMYMKEGARRGISFTLVMCDDVLRRADVPDFAVVRAMRPDITCLLESRGIPVFNNSHVSRICNDKAETYKFLELNKIPVIPWAVVRKGEKLTPPSFPCVLKPCRGHGGAGVTLAKDSREYIGASHSLENDDYIVQRAAADTSDTRVYVIGREIIASVLRRGRGDFRSNFSLGGAAEKTELGSRERELVLSVCNLFKFGLVGIDIMHYNGCPVINEIEDVVGARMLYATYDDIDIVSLYLDFILHQL